MLCEPCTCYNLLERGISTSTQFEAALFVQMIQMCCVFRSEITISHTELSQIARYLVTNIHRGAPNQLGETKGHHAHYAPRATQQLEALKTKGERK